MRAIVYDEHGGPEVVRYADMSRPDPGQGEVLVRLHAAALNRLDLWVRKGWPGLNLSFPHIPGADGAGVIEANGPGAEGFSLGDRVVINASIGCGRCDPCLNGKENLCHQWEMIGETLPGTLAEYISLPASNVLKIPDHCGYDEAAAASLVFLTAWHSLITRGRLQEGETVLIIGASGGVNIASIQIAKWARTHVIVIGSSKEKLNLAESLGADVLIDRTHQPAWEKEVWQATQRHGADVIVNNVGSESMMQSLRAAAPGGRILTVGNTEDPLYQMDNRYLFGKQLSILGSTMSPIDDFHAVMDLVFSGQLKAVIDQHYDLKDTPQALQRLEKGEQLGKLVIDIAA